jgi:hypothetical protein
MPFSNPDGFVSKMAESISESLSGVNSLGKFRFSGTDDLVFERIIRQKVKAANFHYTTYVRIHVK